MHSESISIMDVIKHRSTESKSVQNTEDFGEINEETESSAADDTWSSDVPVDMSSIETDMIELVAISDEHGRISDLIEAPEEETGLSVIPLDMGHVAPEVQNLSRHSIFENKGIRYAMSHRIRNDAILNLQERIIKTLSSALPFEEKLNIKVTYNGTEYETLSLSQDEWTLIMTDSLTAEAIVGSLTMNVSVILTKTLKKKQGF